ncbi:MAG: hypothetical protein CVT71_00985, partial [Alphaproteobacteria bacterium HGW-Alphaproteobacteria-10]
GGLAGAASYDASLTVTAPKNMDGPYYVFVVTDPARAWGTGENGRVREFGREQNNATAAAQPIIVEVPPPADLKVTNVSLPASSNVGEEIRLDYTVTNDSINTAYGRWTDAIYLSSDNTWDLGDILVGKVDHIGDLGANGSYSGTLLAKLPPLKDGNWRVIVRPDLYNEVFEGKISYTATGLNLPPGEANNRTASGATLQVTVPVLPVASPLATTLSPGQSRLYKVSVAAGETLRVSLDAAASEGSNEIYVRYGDIPTGYVFDAAYTNPVAADQEALIGSTKAGDYYVLVRSRQGSADAPVTVRADLLPLSISKITPDQGGTGDDNHRWVTLDIYGAHFKAGALVKLSRPGVFEAEPERWQVLDATHIQAVFDLRNFPLGLYDVSVTNPDGQKVTEATLNGFPSSQIEELIQRDPYRFLIVADKFQTGYDEPLLHTMYVDKTLSGVKAVQTLSRLNRAHPQKHDTFVLDFMNDFEAIKASFEPYYRTTILSEETDPNKLHDLKASLDSYQVYSWEQVADLVALYLGGADRDKLDPILDACVAVYKADLDEDGQVDFKGKAKAFTRTYGFLAAILPYSNANWEKLSIFLNVLTPKLPAPEEQDLSKGILEAIDMDSYRVEAQATMAIVLPDADAEIGPVPTAGGGGRPEPELDLLSNILKIFNEMFGNIEWKDK